MAKRRRDRGTPRERGAPHKTRKQKELEKQASGGDSKHHIRPQSRGGANTMRYGGKNYSNIIVFPDDVGRGNLPIHHPRIHKYFSNKTLLECAIRCGLIELKGGTLNESIFRATQMHKRLRALEAIAGEASPRPRVILERFVEWYGPELVAADVRNQLGGRSVDFLLTRFMEYDDLLMKQTRVVRGSGHIQINESLEIDSGTWSTLWSGDTLFEIIDFRLPAIETRNKALALPLITRMGPRSDARQNMIDAYESVVGSCDVAPAELAVQALGVFERKSAHNQRERILKDRSFEELLWAIGGHIRFLLGKS